MTVWQNFAIRLARSDHARKVVRPVVGRTVLARRFIEYGSAESAVAAARKLRDEHGITASLFYLGEYVDDPAGAEETVQASCHVARLLDGAGLDPHVSVDPSAIGYLTNEDLCRANATRVAETVGAGSTGQRRLMLDMEDLALLDPTLDLFHYLEARGLSVGLTLQARLRRTAHDLAPLVETATSVRLVKGAFPLGPEHDYQGRREIGQSFVALAATMLRPEAKEAGFYPAFATHDDALAGEVMALARANGWQPGEYEFEFLYRVRPKWQLELRRQGHAVRVYLPFGTDWWPYVMRRIGENPRNLLLVTRPLVERGARP
jgi:proline dehydrogenase